MKKTLRFLALAALVAAGSLSACLPESSPAADPAIAEGQKQFKQNCASCHSTFPGQVIVGPSLHGVASRAGSVIQGKDARAYIAASILSPAEYVVEGFPNIMPATFKETLSEEQIDTLVDFLMTFE